MQDTVSPGGSPSGGGDITLSVQVDAATTSGNGPGFGVVGALAAPIRSLFLARRRV